MAIRDRDDGSKLWAVSCYVNPMGYQRRRQNYLRFRRSLSVPLLTVELSYRDGFELEESDADILIRLRGRDVLWQKERLLNVALAQLPRECEKLAWLDCDVLLDGDWPRETERLLDQFSVVQLFSHLIHLQPDGLLEEAESAPPSARRTSLAYRWATRTAPDDLLLRPEATRRERCNCGMAWASQRTLLERHGLYDAMILGMGDKFFAAAAIGRFDDVIPAHHMNPRQADHYLRWAVPFYEEVRGNVGYREGNIFHLWHGDLSDRKYVARYDGFEPFDFDPGHDLAIDPAGCWRWNTNKYALHRHVEQYFRGRREDGKPLPYEEPHCMTNVSF
jgi:hypothetical protein